MPSADRCGGNPHRDGCLRCRPRYTLHRIAWRSNVAFAAGADISEFEQRSSEGTVKEYDGIVDAAQHASRIRASP
jgi:hypothetical protein